MAIDSKSDGNELLFGPKSQAIADLHKELTKQINLEVANATCRYLFSITWHRAEAVSHQSGAVPAALCYGMLVQKACKERQTANAEGRDLREDQKGPGYWVNALKKTCINNHKRERKHQNNLSLDAENKSMSEDDAPTLMEQVKDERYSPEQLYIARQGVELREICVPTLLEFMIRTLEKAKNIPHWVLPACVANSFGLDLSIICEPADLRAALALPGSTLATWVSRHNPLLDHQSIYDFFCLDRQLQVVYPNLSRKLNGWRKALDNPNRGLMIGRLKDNFLKKEVLGELMPAMAAHLYINPDTLEWADLEYALKRSYNWLTSTDSSK